MMLANIVYQSMSGFLDGIAGYMEHIHSDLRLCIRICQKSVLMTRLI